MHHLLPEITRQEVTYIPSNYPYPHLCFISQAACHKSLVWTLRKFSCRTPPSFRILSPPSLLPLSHSSVCVRVRVSACTSLRVFHSQQTESPGCWSVGLAEVVENNRVAHTRPHIRCDDTQGRGLIPHQVS